MPLDVAGALNAMGEMSEAVRQDTLAMVNRISVEHDVPLDVVTAILAAISAYVVLLSEHGHRARDFQERVISVTISGIFETLSGPLGIPSSRMRAAVIGAVDLYVEAHDRRIKEFKAKFGAAVT